MGNENERDDSDSLRDVARWLTTPASAGVFLSVRDLERIGSHLGVSGLPTNRRFAVEQLFRSAAIDDRLPTLFDALIKEVESHRESYRECDSAALNRWETLASESLDRLRAMCRELPR